MDELQTYSADWWVIFLGGLSTLAIFSFLIKENRFYRFFEHLFIGIATGITIMATVTNFFWPQVIKPLFGWNLIVFPDGTMPQQYNSLNLLMLLPMSFGLLYYCILTKRFNWLAQLVIGFQLGVAGGYAFEGTFNELMPQLYDSFRPLYVAADANGSAWENSAANILFMITLVSSMMYFFFTFKRRPGGTVERVAGLGRWLMMGCFGAFFGSTIMARMALLVERLQFLINKWVPVIFF